MGEAKSMKLYNKGKREYSYIISKEEDKKTGKIIKETKTIGPKQTADVPEDQAINLLGYAEIVDAKKMIGLEKSDKDYKKLESDNKRLTEEVEILKEKISGKKAKSDDKPKDSDKDADPGK